MPTTPTQAGPAEGARLDPALLSRPVQGLRLQGATLGEVLGPRPTLLCFLRHFG